MSHGGQGTAHSIHDSERLRSLVDGYHLELNGVRFWAPYWVNNPKLMGDTAALPVRGAFKGKGTPGQLTRSLRQLLREGDSSLSASGYRSLMRAHGLGIDCSGFIYHLLHGWLRSHSRRPLSTLLVTDRAAVLKAMGQRPSWQRRGVTESEVRSWPRWVSLSLVCSRFHKSPRMLTAVATLVHPSVVVPVGRAKDIMPGDMIKFTSRQWGDHIAIVIEQRGSELITAESTEPADRLGGVTYGRVPIVNPEKGLEDQEWERAGSYHPGGAGRDGVWRLKEVAHAG